MLWIKSLTEMHVSLAYFPIFIWNLIAMQTQGFKVKSLQGDTACTL